MSDTGTGEASRTPAAETLMRWELLRTLAGVRGGKESSLVVKKIQPPGLEDLEITGPLDVSRVEAVEAQLHKLAIKHQEKAGKEQEPSQRSSLKADSGYRSFMLPHMIEDPQVESRGAENKVPSAVPLRRSTILSGDPRKQRRSTSSNYNSATETRDAGDLGSQHNEHSLRIIDHHVGNGQDLHSVMNDDRDISGTPVVGSPRSFEPNSRESASHVPTSGIAEVPSDPSGSIRAAASGPSSSGSKNVRNQFSDSRASISGKQLGLASPSQDTLPKREEKYTGGGITDTHSMERKDKHRLNRAPRVIPVRSSEAESEHDISTGTGEV